MPSTGKLTKRWLIVAFKLSVSVSLIAYLLYRVDYDQFANRVRTLSVPVTLAAIGVLALYTVIAGLRWLAVLHVLNCRLSYSAAIRIAFVGSFFNQLLPATIGADAIRVWELYRIGVAVGKAVRSVIFERAFYVFVVSMSAAAGASLWNDGALPGGMTNSLWMLTAGGAAIGALGFLMRSPMPLRFLLPAMQVESNHWFSDWRSLLGSGHYSTVLFLGSMLGLVTLALAVLILSSALGIHLSVKDCAALLPTVLLASALPISIAGWGVREVAMVTVFGYAGMSQVDALALSISLAIASALSSLPGGALWIASYMRKNVRA